MIVCVVTTIVVITMQFNCNCQLRNMCVHWHGEYCFSLLYSLQKIINCTELMRWGQPRRQGWTCPEQDRRLLARFDWLGSTRALWSDRNNRSHQNHRRHRVPPRPRWLVDQTLVMEALHPPPSSRRAVCQLSRLPPVCQFVCLPPIL